MGSRLAGGLLMLSGLFPVDAVNRMIGRNAAPDNLDSRAGNRFASWNNPAMLIGLNS